MAISIQENKSRKLYVNKKQNGNTNLFRLINNVCFFPDLAKQHCFVSVILWASRTCATTSRLFSVYCLVLKYLLDDLTIVLIDFERKDSMHGGEKLCHPTHYTAQRVQIFLPYKNFFAKIGKLSCTQKSFPVFLLPTYKD